MISFKPLIAIFHYCIYCDKIMPFDGNSHCFLCGCDSPFGELNDYSISEAECDEERFRTEVIGDVSSLPVTHWFHTQKY